MSFTRSRTFSQIAPGQAAKENTNQSQLPSAARLDRPKIKTKANRSEPRQSWSRSERFSARQAKNQNQSQYPAPIRQAAKEKYKPKPNLRAATCRSTVPHPKSNQSQFPARIHPFE